MGTDAKVVSLRYRDRRWANPDAYLRVSVVQWADEARGLGPWAHLFDRASQEAIGEPTPQVVTTLMPPFNVQEFLTQDWEPWTGTLDPADQP